VENKFITKINIKKVRHLREVNIPLSNTERKHLILTGKNGSGKTSILNAMLHAISSMQTSFYGRMIQGYGVHLQFNQTIIHFPEVEFVYIKAKRADFNIPKSIEPAQKKGRLSIAQNINSEFLKYILALDYQLYGAITDGNKILEANTIKWFDNFLAALRNIYDCPDLKLERDAKNLSFKIIMPGREPFTLNEMSDGYAAFIKIMMELLMRLESEDAVVDFDKPAIVLIDELETHMHVELQKRALPFLTKMFPNVQFIVATHSPFVITSLENAIVFDLEKRERLENPSFYAYDTVVESFLDTSMYSDELQKYFKRYKALCLKERTPEENEEFRRAKVELEIRAIPSTELYIAFHELEAKRKVGKNGSLI